MVGCGQKKQDTEEPVPAGELYTSTYFQLKKQYAEARSQPITEENELGWAILSAKHDLLFPHIEVEPYNTTVDDLREDPAPVEPEAYQHTRYPWDEPLYNTRLDFWARRVHYGLAGWLGMKSGFPEEKPHCQRLIVLAGEKYLEPLFERDVFEPFPWKNIFPFQEQDFSGIGEQMAWLKEETEFYLETRNDSREIDQLDLEDHTFREANIPEPDIDVPDVEGQSSWGDWEQ